MMRNEIERLAVTPPVLTSGEGSAPPGGGGALWSLLHDRLRGSWARAIMVGLVLGVLLGTAGYVFTTPKYESVGLIRVAPVISPILQETPETRMVPLYPAFVQTQARLIESRPVLERSLDQLLASVPWAQQVGALARLERALNVAAGRDSELITVRFSDDDPKVAQAAVNAVIRAYDALYGSGGGEEVARTLNTLQVRRSELRRLRTEKLNEVQQFLSASEHGAADLDVLASTTTAQLAALDQTIAQREEVLRAMSPGEEGADHVGGPDQMELAAVDAELAHLLVVARDLKLELAVARQRWAADHPPLVRLQQKVDAVEEAIRQREDLVRSQRHASPERLQPRTREDIEAAQEASKRMAARLREQLRQINTDQGRLAEMRAALGDIDENLAEIDRRIKYMQIETESGRAGRISIAAYGDLPLAPSRDRRRSLAVVGAVAGFGLSVGVFFLIGTIDRRTHAAVQLRGHAGRPCLGVLPDLRRSRLDPEAGAMAAHCVHQIRNRLEVLRDANACHVIAVTSPSKGDGKTSVAIALGWSYAAAGSRTLLVDCDMTGASLSHQMGILNRAGLKETLRSGAANGEVLAMSIPRLSVLPVGDASGFGAEGIRTDRLASVFEQLRREFDVIIVDTGPMPCSLEGIPVVAISDAVLVVCRRGQRRARLDDCLEFLATAGAACAGVVLNCAELSDCDRYVSRSSASRPAGAGKAPEPPGDGPPDIGESNIFVQAMKAAAVQPRGAEHDTDHQH